MRYMLLSNVFLIFTTLVSLCLAVAYRNHAPTPTPGPSPPSAECHHPSGTTTLSPGPRQTSQAPSNPAASSNALLLVSSCSGERSEYWLYPEVSRLEREVTDIGIVEVFLNRGEVEGESNRSASGGRRWNFLCPTTTLSVKTQLKVWFQRDQS